MKSKKTISPKIAKGKALETINKGQFPIVGIGASAGGLEALEQFFQNMPDNTGLAFVVIQHLAPDHKGIMPELLQRITPMKVQQASDKLLVKPDCVYVIPPNKSLSILNGILQLSDPVESHGLRLPIDIFFRSLAEDKQEKSIGVILSGMGSDGSLGLQAIEEKKGTVLVQDPGTAKFDGMPCSAINSVIADIVAPADKLPGKLLSFLRLNPQAKPDSEIDSKIKSNIDKIIILLREQSGHDFSLYKKTTLFRRIERRKSVHQIDKIQDYVRLMQENPKEVEILYKELLIGVTSFFRDINVWKKLKDSILPDLIKKHTEGNILRAWVTGCSTGEEAYTLAITFKEALEKVKKHMNVSLQIFATDLDTDAIEKARQGYYAKNIIADVSPERISRFFTPVGDGFHINASIREMVVFATQNVIKDPPFTRLNIITCRNMLIYMEPELQKKLIALFDYSLKPGGIMVLGTSETLGTHNTGFTAFDAKLKIFRRSATLTSPEFIDFPSSFRSVKSVLSQAAAPPIVIDNIQTIADHILLQHFAPASVLVTDKGDILYITGRTGKYLEPVAGKANWNIHAMARAGIRNELPGVFRKAQQSSDPVVLRNLKVGTNGGTQFIDITVQRIENPESMRGMIMIVFEDVPTIINHSGISKTEKGKSSMRQKELEIELQRTIEEIQSIREEMQTSQEELKSTNEELQSTNEELQSTNEELTTSKEEMQSLNEELQTVNIELQSKVNDFIHANDDMKNLLNSTEIATLFLDKQLNIRRFTDPVANIFKVRNSDAGRPLTDLGSNLLYPELDNHAHQVMKTLASIETEISTIDDKWFKIRIMPYRTIDDRIDGLVLTFNDITFSKKLELKLKEANEALHKRKDII
jgi:two-component system CheB/CheR fusion protein